MYVAGIDQGSTYTKAAILGEEGKLLGKAMVKTGFRLNEAAQSAYDKALEDAGLMQDKIRYVVATGYGRHQVPFRDTQVTDLTAHARGACHYFPGTRTILDVGGQTMKASRLDDRGKVQWFRLNDKCAAGTGTFLEKTARYMGYSVEEIGPLVATSKEGSSISGVCAVFAESEVINQLSTGSSPADIMHGAMESLVGRSVQLMKRVRLEPEYTVVGGIMRYQKMHEAMRIALSADVNCLPPGLVQYSAAIGAALLGQRRLARLEGAAAHS